MKKSNQEHKIKTIARIETDFKEKFGIPRQSGIIPELSGKIIFEKEYRDVNAIRGLEKFTHLWLLWLFSENLDNECFPTIRPPRLGGEERIGVFATRSPFRPNSIGLSSVKLDHIEISPNFGPIIYVNGADLLNDTPIIDIKPYIPYTDSHPNAGCSFAKSEWERELKVIIPPEILKQVDETKQQSLLKILAQDPRPAYKEDSDDVYTMSFADYEVSFIVNNKILNVTKIEIHTS